MLRTIGLLAIIALVTSCNDSNDTSSSKQEVNVEKQNKTEVEIDSIPEIILSKADSLLLHPFDLIAFKKKKRGSLSGGAGSQSYYFQPDTIGVLYRYFLIGAGRSNYIGKDPSKRIKMFNPLELVVFKPKDKNWQMYGDPNETLLELMQTANDADLPELAFIGWTKPEIVEELGTPAFEKNNCLVYTKDQFSLLIHIDKNKVDWLKYNHLNQELREENDLPKLYSIKMHQF